MDSLSKKLQNLGIHDIRNAARFAQNVIVQYEPYQVDIRRATNTDAWGPTPKHLSKVLRNRYQVPMYLMTEYILKRLIDHIAKRPKNLYEKARKDYVNYGAEWRVVLKCITVIEFLMLNVDDGDELNQIKSCLVAHKHILTREVANFKVNFSNDGKMEVHERGIKKKNELILQYLDDPQFLKKERLRNKKNAQKIRNNIMAGGVGNDLSTVSGAGASYNANHPSYSGDHVTNSEGFDYDFDDEDDSTPDHRDDDDEFNDFATASTGDSNQPKRTPTNLERQRKQRREILRERIKTTEQQRKNRENMKKQQEEQANVPDLLDLDFDSPAPSNNNNNNNMNVSSSIPTSGITNLNVSSNNNDDNDDDDDGFGDFQSEPTTNAPSISTSNGNVNKNATLDELLGKTTTATTTNNNNTSLNDKDLFSDLFNNSKSLI